MKNFKSQLICLFIAALLFSACSIEGHDSLQANESEELISLALNINSFEFEKNFITKQQSDDFPACSDDTPFYVEIILMQDNIEMLGDPSAPFRIDLTPNEMFTKDVPEMKLAPGLYYLDYCAVYNEAGSLLCLAPRADSPMAVFSDAPMPMSINLSAGSKPFPDIPVMCYDDRDVNEYGYVFYNIKPNTVHNFCFFANYCSDNGRHFSARYSLDIAIDGDIIYSDTINNTGKYDNGDYFADPLCVALPNLSEYEDDEKYIDYTLTLLPWEEVYSLEEELEITGSLSRNDIIAHFDGDENVEYEHIFFNCDN
jgi:hypothetical protein